MRKAIITVGLGFGSEGKGVIVDSLSRIYNADLIVRYSGGSQPGRTVQLPTGERYSFCYFGAGTFNEIPTFLGPQVIVNLEHLCKESQDLHRIFNINPYRQLYIHPYCLITTIFHTLLDQIYNITKQSHHSCGHGIGLTRAYWLKYGYDAIVAGDLTNYHVLYRKLELLRQRIFQTISDDCSRRSQAIDDIVKRLYSINLVTVTTLYYEIGSMYTLTVQPPKFTTAIFEGIQGVLLDEWHGFHPFTTYNTITTQYALELVHLWRIDKVCVLGVMRPYHMRYGPGPLTIETTDAFKAFSNDFDMVADLVKPRYGWLDIPLLKYAITACDLIMSIDGLAITHLDQIGDDFGVCSQYSNHMTNSVIETPIDIDYFNLTYQHNIGLELTHGKNGSISEFMVKAVHSITMENLLTYLNCLKPILATTDGPTYCNCSTNELPFHYPTRV